MKFLFTAFGLHNNFISSEVPDHAIFPLSKQTVGGLDLDYTALMIGEQFTIDKQAFDFVSSECQPFLAPMARTLKVLNHEGLVNILDYETLINQRSEEIIGKTEVLLEDPMPWVRIARRQWDFLGNECIEFHKEFGHHERYPFRCTPILR